MALSMMAGFMVIMMMMMMIIDSEGKALLKSGTEWKSESLEPTKLLVSNFFQASLFFLLSPF